MSTYNESNYRFTDPIRYFKANDPYYFEVDNIPLKQLHENTLWLKDQLAASITFNEAEIDRSGFSELKPYCSGIDSVVKVKPGRFTARINDAYNLNRLQFIEFLYGDTPDSFNLWKAARIQAPEIQSILNSFKGSLTGQAKHMNGLAERVFTYPAREIDQSSQYLKTNPQNTEGYTAGPNIDGMGTSVPSQVPTAENIPIYPILEAQLWGYGSWAPGETTPGGQEIGPGYVIKQYNTNNTNIGFASMGSAETAFIKRWRGVARTSVVDVSEELQIQVPAFDEQDFYYIDQAGQRHVIPSDHRIDLLFIYSKPIDASSVTIAKFINNTPTTITRPILGLVRGAGLGLDLSNQILRTVKSTTFDGTIKILADSFDQTDPNNSGFLASSIKGSFPSPDDLMNLTPILDEDLTNTNYALIGQTILPIAYVVVRKEASLNALGEPIITKDDIIDIRPFFRTTELSYNERAGLAAAIPAPSLANPVVTQGELERTAKDIYDVIDIKTQVREVQRPRIIGGGYVKGGQWFGPEGVLMQHVNPLYDIDNGAFGDPKTTDTAYTVNYRENARLDLVNRGIIPTDYLIPKLPEWDLASWINVGMLNPGYYGNDRINIFQYGRLGAVRSSVTPVATSTYTLNDDPPFHNTSFNNLYGDAYPSFLRVLGTDATNNANDGRGQICIMYCSKTIQIDRNTNNVDSWMRDYDVQVQLQHCVPISSRAFNTGAAGAANIWVEKHRTYFKIHVAWVAQDWYPAASNSGIDLPSRRDSSDPNNNFAGFAVITDLLNQGFTNSRLQTFSGETFGGFCIYPTISFSIIGYPKPDVYSGFVQNFTAGENLIPGNTIILQ